LEASATYNIDLQPLKKVGDTVEYPISQVLQSKAADRFEVIVGLKDYTLGTRRWTIKPTLITSDGDVNGNTFDITIPVPLMRQFMRQFNQWNKKR
jgi:hypothetical protein